MAPRLPVVFMHGFGAVSHVFRDRSVVRIVGYMRERGIDAYGPEVDAYNTIPERAAQWKKHIEEILRQSGKPAVHLIGFSCGGLDARFLISKCGGDRFVHSLTTVSAPHRGSSLARYILDRPETIRSGLEGIAEWLVRQTSSSGESRFLAALGQLTPAYVSNVFNPSVPDAPGVRYYSFAGQAGRSASTPVTPPLLPGNRIIFAREGINDGFVSVASSRWTGFIGCIDADHAEQIGIDRRGRFDAPSFYSDIAMHLARDPVSGL